jgi:hypothetical protein
VGGARGLFTALAVLTLARSAYAGEARAASSEGEEQQQPIQAVRISGQQWSALDAAQTRGGLDSYQYSLGVVSLSEPGAEVREPIPSERLVSSDVLLVEAPPDAIAALREGKPLRDVLASVLGGEGAVLAPAAEDLEEEPKPTEHQIALVLPAGALKASFAPGQEVSAERLLALGAELVLDVRPESPCDEKCNIESKPVQLEPQRIDDPASLPPPELVARGLPPEGGAAPLIKVGGPNLVHEADESGVIRFHAETGGSGEIYRWFLTSNSGESWFVGDTVRGRAVDFTLAEANLEASYQVQALVYAWDTEQGRWSTFKQNIPGPGGGGGPPRPVYTYDVGVIPDGGCPYASQAVTLHMDDEDRRNANGRWGWRGAITSDSNTTLRFCRVDGTKFKPLSTGNYTSNHYAVLKLGNTCPNDSVNFTRHFDNEDNRNANWSSGGIGLNVSDRNTTLRFCLFRNGPSTMSSMPDLGFGYGVFAASNFSKALQTGGIHTDDEDNNNANYYIDVVGNAMTDINRIINDTRNTNMNLARVK